MKVLERGSMRKDCYSCKSKLEYEVEDIKVKNTAAAYAGETWDPVAFIICPICKGHITVSGESASLAIRGERIRRGV